MMLGGRYTASSGFVLPRSQKRDRGTRHSWGTRPSAAPMIFFRREERAMRIRSIERILGAFLVGVVMGIPTLSGQQFSVVSRAPSKKLKLFLESYLNPGHDKTTRIQAVSLKIKGRTAEEILVYISGWLWCASGGCTLVILEPSGSSFKVLGRVTTVKPPVRVLNSISHGLPDIGVYVQGGGIVNGYEGVLSFDGANYPISPSLPPAQKATKPEVKGLIISEQLGVPLIDPE